MQGKLKEFYAFLSAYRVKIKYISAIKLQIRLSFYICLAVYMFVKKEKMYSNIYVLNDG